MGSDIILKGFQMFPLWTLGFAWLIFRFTTACEPSVGTRNGCYRKYCNGAQYDPQEAVCCENKLHTGAGLSCCGEEPYNSGTATCCKVHHGHNITAAVTPGLSEEESECCALKAFNPVNQMCCDSTITAKPASAAKCCGKEGFDKDKQMCCGPHGNRRILMRNSDHDECCFQQTFNNKTHCCFENKEKNVLEIHPKNSTHCPKESPTSKGVKEQITEPRQICSEQKTDFCGSSCYNPKTHQCCERNQNRHRFPASAAVYDPHEKICCDGHVSTRKSSMDQCCGQTPYDLAQRGVLCCNKTLYMDREDGEECSEMGIPYNPAKGTICCSQFHASPGQHCCGTEIYHPHIEICCNGHRHRKSNNTHCCGVKAYNIKDPQMKCCAGTLYNLTSLKKHGEDAQCCGSILQKPQGICCSSQDKEVLYPAKSGFRCCGHLYYNSTLWSCCAGRLRSIHGAGQDQREMTHGSSLLSFNNLNKTELCKEMHIGTVETVSLHGIVFKDVMKIDGTQAKVEVLPLTHILHTGDRCSFPKLIPGKTYFFAGVNVFIDFNHDSVLQSLHFIISKCSH